MDKTKLLNLLQEPQPLTNDSLSELKTIIEEYPYFQIPYFLVAKHHYLTGNPEKELAVQVASAYASDRKILKSFITKPFSLSENTVPVESIETEDENSSISNSLLEEQHLSDKENEVIKISNEIIQEENDIVAPNHKELISTTSHKTDNNISQAPGISEASEISSNDFTEESSVKEVPFSPESTKTESEILRLEKKEEAESSFEKSERESVAPEEDSKKDLAPQEHMEDSDDSFIMGYLNNPKDSKEESVNYKRKHQNDLIERFIKSSPSLKRAEKVESENSKDLSEPSVALDNNLVSENLAVIMVKQGKIEKAIDIYKKLIWKYPQKKAYFANRIQELKK